LARSRLPSWGCDLASIWSCCTGGPLSEDPRCASDALYCDSHPQ
jgi:hypothetical protein